MAKSSRLEFGWRITSAETRSKTEPVKEQQAPKKRRTSRLDRRGRRPKGKDSSQIVRHCEAWTSHPRAECSG